MAVIINEFEVITDAPRSVTDPAQPPVAPPQPPPPLTPEVIVAIWHREMERCARVQAG
jgi:hypothetical protein